MGQKGREFMLKIHNTHRIWREEEVPTGLKKSLVLLIFKNKRNKKECNNYRGLSLLSSAMLILEQIIDKRLRIKL